MGVVCCGGNCRRVVWEWPVIHCLPLRLLLATRLLSLMSLVEVHRPMMALGWLGPFQSKECVCVCACVSVCVGVSVSVCPCVCFVCLSVVCVCGVCVCVS